MKKWFKVQNKADITEIFINSDILSDYWNDGWYECVGLKDNNTYPLQFKEELDKAEGEVHLHINSGGGDLFAGVAIGNMIRNSGKKVTAYVDGTAASAASVIALSCNVVKIPANAYLMIHRVSGGVFGDADDFQKAIETFEILEEGIVNGYMEKVQDGITREQITDYMKEEKWFTGEQAAKVFKIDVGEAKEALNFIPTKDKGVKYPQEILNRMEQAKEKEATLALEVDLALAGVY